MQKGVDRIGAPGAHAREVVSSVSQLNDVPERDLAEALNGTSDHRLDRSRNG